MNVDHAPIWYDRDGVPIGDRNYESIEAKLRDPAYKRVAEDTVQLPDGTTRWVSTVWLGVDHNWGRGRPIIFETMTFQSAEFLAEAGPMCRYSTEAEARGGHAAIVDTLRVTGT